MKENKYMEENRYRVDRRILLFDGDVVDDERAMWYAQSRLSNIDSAISKVLRLYYLLNFIYFYNCIVFLIIV